MKKLLIAAALTLSGCGSIMNFDYYHGGPRVYGGVRIDAGGRMWSDDVVGYVDLPFSFIVDTALLPMYLIFEAFRG